MAKPATVPEWATNANFASPGDPWDGDPTKVAPPAGKIAEGWEPTEEPPAEFFNYWQNLVGEWLDWLDSRLDDTFPTAVDFVYEIQPSRKILVGPRVGNGESGWSYNLIDRATCSTNSHDLFIDITAFLRTGMTLTAVEALVKPGTTALMEIQCYRTELGAAFDTPADPNDVQIGVLGQSDGSNAWQPIDIGAVAESVDLLANNIVVAIKASSSAGATSDWYAGLRLTVDDPGPRNY